MKERPILFSAPMVRAILGGRKTQTRRVMKPQPVWVGNEWRFAGAGWNRDDVALVLPGHSMANRCPYGTIGDRLRVRETWQMIYERMDGQRFTHPIENARQRWVEYAATPRDEHEPPKWKPSIFMPRRASRITLEVVNVRVERLQKIGTEDAKAEGMSNLWTWNSDRNESHPEHFVRGILNPYVANFSVLWDEINGKSGFGWDVNPWVWVIEFRKV